MNNELEQQAIETFAAVPEVYQQAFRDAGADFPDELVAEIKKDPNQAVNLVNSDKNLKNAVVTIFKNNQEAIMQAVQQTTSMFKNGGKFDYLYKLKCGGKVKKAQTGSGKATKFKKSNTVETMPTSKGDLTLRVSNEPGYNDSVFNWKSKIGNIMVGKITDTDNGNPVYYYSNDSFYNSDPYQAEALFKDLSKSWNTTKSWEGVLPFYGKKQTTVQPPLKEKCGGSINRLKRSNKKSK